MIKVAPDAFAFTFLGRTELFPRKNPWGRSSTDRRLQLWRMNLHYMEYLEEVTDAIFCELVVSWIGAMRPYVSGSWKDAFNSYCISQRTLVWMQQLAVRPGIADDVRRMAEDSLMMQIEFLARNLETDLGGNHLVKNLKALLWASVFFEGPAGKRWRNKGLALLDKVLAEQILSDGVHYERSPSYHAQVFADLLELRSALKEDPTSGELDKALSAMAQALVDLAHPDRLAAQFNDAGLSMAYSPTTCLDAAAALLGLRPKERDHFAYPEAGYFGARRGNDFLVVDCGPIGPDTLPAHGHGDVLSFEFSVSGRRLIVDQGVFEYVAGAQRTMSRSARFHNTLCPDCADQAEFFGDFRVGRRPRAYVLSRRATPHVFELTGTHDGYDQLVGRPRHVRSFIWQRCTLTLVDRWEGRGGPEASISLLLHPDWHVMPTGGGELTMHREGVNARLISSAPTNCEPGVWWPDMGIEHATTRVKIGPVPTGTTIVTRIEVGA
jgi:uncharacterized heparinase superfamily protein